MCSSRDIHAIIAYCLVCLFVLVLLEAGQMEELVGGSLCHCCLGSRYTEWWTVGFSIPCIPCFKKYIKATEVLLGLCLHIEKKVLTRITS